MRAESTAAEGDWISVPLENGGFGAALVLRKERSRSRLKSYMLAGLPKRFDLRPSQQDIGTLTILDIRAIVCTGDFTKFEGYARIAAQPDFSREAWPLLLQPSGDRYFASRDNDKFEFQSLRRDLIEAGLHRYFLQDMPEMHARAMEVVIPDLAQRGNKSEYHYRVTQAHLDAYEKIKPLIKKHAR